MPEYGDNGIERNPENEHANSNESQKYDEDERTKQKKNS